MVKKYLLFIALLWACASQAAVDVNTATVAELDGIKGIGPATSARILAARQEAGFKDWADFIQRVKGINKPTAAKLSTEGLTVNGSHFEPSPGK